jgi:predicted kinase
MPSGNEPRPALIILSGLPGTGKTTFALALAALIPFRHIESDAVRGEIFKRLTFSFNESRIVFADIDRRLKRALAAREVALVDATNLAREHRARLRGFAIAAEARCVEVRLTAPEATVRERLSRPRKGHSRAGFEVYDGMRDGAEASPHPVLTVDTRYPLEPSLRAVLALLGESA